MKAAPRLSGECRLLRIFAESSAKWRGLPLVDEIVSIARDSGMAGATVFEGIEGFRAGGRLQKPRSSSWTLSCPKESLVEIVDRPESVELFVKANAEMLKGSVVSVERAFIPSLEEA